MENINLITSEIFISLSLMSLLILGVFKNNSSSIVYNLSIFTLFLSLLINLNLFSFNNFYLFNGAYKIDHLSNFMKVLIIVSGIFVMLSSSKYLKIF